MSRPGPTTIARKRWRFLQISLRTLFVLMTIGCVWLGILAKRARDQRVAVARCLELGGEVLYDYQADVPWTLRKNASPPAWPWLRRAIGDEYFQKVIRVDLGETAVTDADLRLFGKLPGVKGLELAGTGISDTGLSHLRNCRQLEGLGLLRTNITNDGLREIQRLSGLKDLALQKTKIDDHGLDYVSGLTQLESLHLGDTAVTSNGMAKLSQLTKLRTLHLYHTGVDDTAIDNLAAIPTLAYLDIRGTLISVEGLRRLREALPSCSVQFDDLDLPSSMLASMAKSEQGWRNAVRHMKSADQQQRVKLIDLSGAQITDRHLADLHGLTNVRMIDLRDTKVTDAGVEALQKALPKCKVRQ